MGEMFYVWGTGNGKGDGEQIGGVDVAAVICGGSNPISRCHGSVGVSAGAGVSVRPGRLVFLRPIGLDSHLSIPAPARLAGDQAFLACSVRPDWPAHATSLVIVVATATAVLSSFDGTNLPFYMTTNLLMVQSWIPSRAAISLNGPSWSISTEFAFYLMFPLLISDFARTWHVKLVGAIVLSFLIVVACFALGIDWGHGAFPVIVGFPLTRLFEFVLGMCAALLWRRLPALHIGPVYGTALELAALGLVVLASHLAVRVPNPGSAPSAWLAICALPSVPAALLIVAMAMNRGLISRALSFPAAVFLGEISYSVYLLHGLIAYVVAFRLPQMSPAQMSAAYVATLLVLAAAAWYFVERPARVALTSGAWRRRAAEIVPEMP